MQANTTPDRGSPHRIGFMQHSKITREMGAIDASKQYDVTDISPNGGATTTKYVGAEIKQRYSQIFGNYAHGYILTPAGGRVPIFVYVGPIPSKVDAILSSIH